MTEAQAIELICEQMNNAWPAASGSIPFILPDEATLSVPSFAMLSWRHTGSRQITQGTPARFERRLLIMVKVWAAANTGTAGLAALCDAARTVFEKQQLPLSGDEPVTIDAGVSGTIEQQATWVMSMVSFPARYYASR